MESLVGYGSDDDNETDRYTSHHTSMSHGTGGGSGRRREDDTNYDDVNMDMSEDSQEESEPELPPAEPAPPRPSGRDDRPYSNNGRDSRDGRDDRRRDDRQRDDRADRQRHDRDARPSDTRDARSADRHGRPDDRYGNRDVRPDEKYRSSERDGRADDKYRSDRDRRSGHEGRRGLLGDRPDDRSDGNKVPSLMDLKPFGGEGPPSHPGRSHDARDAVSPRFVDRDRRDRDRERERDRHGRRSEEKRDRHSRSRSSHPRSRSRDRSEQQQPGARPRPPAAPPADHHTNSFNERRVSPPSAPSSEYRPSYKVNKKLEVMEKMGLQIKTPDGSMATAQQLRQAASEAPAAPSAGLPSFFNAGTSKILDQVQKRKLLWSNKKSEAEEAAKWSGTRFAQDSDGKQVSKFMRLMGIKEPNAVKQEPPASADPIKKQEELFQAMQAQYEVARATTHTMRGVGLGFQRGQF